MNSRILLEKNTLWKAVLQTSEKALQTGAQFPIPTEYEFIGDAGVRFFVRILASLRKKAAEKQKQQSSEAAGISVNPFLPYDKALHVADISDTHSALLNKYNVVDHHLLIVTRHFEDQEVLLTISDFEALWACMAEYNGLGFYNGGEAAGASQRHKHLQMVPLPLAPEGPEIPIEPLFHASNLQGCHGHNTCVPFQTCIYTSRKRYGEFTTRSRTAFVRTLCFLTSSSWNDATGYRFPETSVGAVLFYNDQKVDAPCAAVKGILRFNLDQFTRVYGRAACEE